eukprot:TRINITY_DN1169_c0_g2_i1.p1 TRINITY_DN1169_c0_g2~~TRINITY_DN1169_c0_g2_i1.p1  ORF type:complete len:286 (-),score=41.41 TRINITY_DN1169_c0_g2_i1:381-1136(-)
MVSCMCASLLSPLSGLQTSVLTSTSSERRFPIQQFCSSWKVSTSSLQHEGRRLSLSSGGGSRRKSETITNAAQFEPVTEKSDSSKPSWSSVTVGEVMNACPVTVGPDTTIWEVMKTLVEKRISGVAVVDENREVLGFVSGYDLLALDAAPGQVPSTGLFPSLDMPWQTFKDLQKKLQNASGRTAKEIMSPVKDSAKPSDRVEDVASIMIKHRRHRVIVVNEDSTLAGIVSRTDVLRATVRAMGYVVEEESR